MFVRWEQTTAAAGPSADAARFSRVIRRFRDTNHVTRFMIANVQIRSESAQHVTNVITSSGQVIIVAYIMLRRAPTGESDRQNVPNTPCRFTRRVVAFLTLDCIVDLTCRISHLLVFVCVLWLCKKKKTRIKLYEFNFSGRSVTENHSQQC